ncbi:metal-dependent hydrolase [Halobacterium salinarum]|uniref:metal-dependent hydrolase n=1 Tax=Halobacterium salinarum TaxID=2242 RepID=UPI00255583E2|nr:metal-dependent hydrolase [Halobacterium salinarum]MDL0123103.1 metal-dependent hydrolase [Halobacterium salinarum]
MHQKGHYGAALAAYAPVVFILTALGYTTLGVLGGAVVVGGAMLPDIDQRLPGVKHRGPTHTVWFALAVGAVAGVVGLLLGASRGMLAALGTGLFGAVVGTLAVVAHILADVLTPTGVRPFAPVRDEKYTFDIVTAANPIANYALLVLGAVVAGVAVAGGLALST